MNTTQARIKKGIIFANAMVVAIVGLALFGWFVGDVDASTGFIGTRPIKINAAVGLGLLGLAAPFGYLTACSKNAKRVALMLTTVAGLIGLLTAVEWLAHVNFGIDEMLGRDTSGTGQLWAPGRMAASTAIVMTGLAIATGLNVLRRRPAVAQGIAVMTGLVGYFVLASYAFDSPSLMNSVGNSRMAINTAVIVLATSLVAMFSQQDHAFAQAIVSEAAGGLMARRLLPVCILAPLVMGGVVSFLMKMGVLDPKLATSSMAMAATAMILPVVIGLSWTMNGMSTGLSNETRAQASLASELKALITALPIGVMVVDAASREPKSMNARAVAILGEPIASETKGVFSGVQRITDQQGKDFPPEFLPQEISLRDGKEAAGDVVIQRPDGSNVSVRLRSVPVAGEDGKAMAAIMTIEDVTDVGEEQRQRIELAALLSEQLKTPLASVRWTIESLASGDYGPLNSDQMTAAKQALNSSERMGVIVRDILNSYRIEAGRLDIKPHWATVTEFMDAPVEEARAAAQARNITVSFTNGAFRRIYIDTSLMKQAVGILLANAVKYSPDGGTVTVKAEEKGNSLLLEVADRGIGIAEAERGRIFTKFYRADNAKKASAEGTGLGLYVCKALIEAFSGNINFESEPGHGTTFRVVLPIINAPSEPSGD
jgi:signal transduction histidine kinase